MKIFYIYLNILLTGLLLSKVSSAQINSEVNLNHSKNHFEIISSDLNRISFENNINSFSYQKEQKNNRSFIKITSSNYSNSNTIGYPELPVLKKLIQIPIDAELQIKILSYDQEIINLANHGITDKILPKQETVAKSENEDNVVFSINNEIYTSNQFSNNNKVSVEIIGIKRGKRIARINICPFDYNPVKNSLIVYKNIKAEIEFINGNHQKTEQLIQKTASRFSNLDGDIINSKAYKNSYEITEKPIKMVIVADPIFKDSLQSFITWKKKKGFEIIELYMGNDSVGHSNEEVKEYLQNIYDNATTENPAPTFGLIVGDHDKIPAFDGNHGNHVTDLYYFEYTNDFFPELFYGRFPANNNEELMNIIKKTIEYETYTMETTSFLDNATLVAGVDVSYGPYFANSHVNYSSTYYFNEEHGFNTNKYLHPGSGANASNIIETVNNGVGILKYSGHCLYTGWRDPEFLYSDVYNLTNNGMYPTVIGNCCESVRFEKPSSFGEVWLRAPNKGAIGYIGASNLSYWVEDYYFDNGFGNNITANPTYETTTFGAMDLLFHEHGEPENLWALTNGQILNAGNMAVTEAGTDRVNYYWEVYHLMGDPSLMTYLSVPEEMNITHEAQIYLGVETLNISAEDGAYVAISINNELIDAKFANASQEINFQIPYFENEVNIDVVATKQNKIPYIGKITTLTSNEVLLTYSSHSEKNIEGFIDSLITFGETINLDIDIRNIGLTTASDLTCTLTSSSNLITLTDNSEFIEQIEAQSLINLKNAFQFEVQNSIFGKNIIPFELTISDNNNNQWQLFFTSIVYGPLFQIRNVAIDDSKAGNSNNKMNVGEIINLNLDIKNLGLVASTEMNLELSSLNTKTEIFNNSVIPSLKTDSIINHEFIISTDASLSPGSIIDLNLILKSETHYYDTLLSFNTGYLIDNFESANFKNFNWDTTHTNPWLVYSQSSDEDVFSKNFAIKSSNIDDNDSSILKINMNIIEDDSISFYKKVSCQKGSMQTYADYLEFLIDTVSMGIWRGEIDWSYESFPVKKGEHTFIWKYLKDANDISGDDCAWIDYISLPMDSAIYHNTPPEFTSTPTTFVNTMESYNYDIEVSDKDNDNITIQQSNLPEWLTYENIDNGASQISGLPTNENAGTYLIQLAAFDGKSYANQVFELEVNNSNTISKNEKEKAISIYPNPSRGNFTISLENPNEKIIYVSVFNNEGKLVLKNTAVSTSYPIKIDKKGIYYVKVIFDRKILIKPIVIY